MSYLERDIFGIYKAHKGPGPYLMGAHTLTGEKVVNHHAEELGSIKEFMLDMRTGKVAYAVMSFGLFSVGEKLFAVPWTAMRLDTVNKCFVVNIEREHLINAPGFEKDAWPDMNDPEWVHDL